MRNRNVNLTILGIILICLGIVSNNLSVILLTNENFYNDNEINLKRAGYWEISPIYIDDIDPSYNWAITVSTYDWCSGSGTILNPYIIENVTIDGGLSGNCIDILNSDAYFTLQNCTVYNSGTSSLNAGIKLYNATNGMIINNHCFDNSQGIRVGYMGVDNTIGNTIIMENNCSYNSNTGIVLVKYSNNTILRNNCSFNGVKGIQLAGGAKNTVSENSCFNNEWGIFLSVYTGMPSTNNTISGNNIFNNTQNGIQSTDCNDNLISGNNITNNAVNGIYLQESSNNTVIENICFNNTDSGIFLCINSSDNYLGGNFLDYNHDGIFVNDSSSSNNISQNICYKNSYGIRIYSSINNKVYDNTIYNSTYYGIMLRWSYESIITHNNVYNNTLVGIHLHWSDNNIISENNCTYSNYGMWFAGNTHCDSNNITENIITYNQIGIILSEGQEKNNQFHYNFFINNTLQARDDGTNNQWDNEIKGNYWSEYGGVDSDDDGIGETPYSIAGTANSQDNYPLWWDKVSISINSPSTNDAFEWTAPSFTISIDIGVVFDSWYTIDEGLTNITFTGTTGSIVQTEWDKKSDGSITIIFYTMNPLIHGFGYITFSQVNIIKDTTNPTLQINSPTPNELFGTTAPSFNVEISDTNLDTMWYTIDGGITKYFFLTNSSLNLAAWSALSDGVVAIQFYANDTAGNIGFAEVTIRKDANAPIITINNPQNSDVIGATAPNFDISIDELNLDETWYSLNGGNNITFTGLTGTINQALWDALSEGNVIIRFYANDTLGRIGFQEVTVVKTIPQPSPPGIPGYNILLLLGIVSTIAVIIIKKRLNHLIN